MPSPLMCIKYLLWARTLVIKNIHGYTFMEFYPNGVSRCQKNTYLQNMHALKHAQLLQSYPTLATLWTVAHRAPLSMRFSRQEYWSRLPFSSPLQNISILNNHFITVALSVVHLCCCSCLTFVLPSHNFLWGTIPSRLPVICQSHCSFFLKGGCVTRVSQLECCVLLAQGIGSRRGMWTNKTKQ